MKTMITILFLTLSCAATSPYIKNPAPDASVEHVKQCHLPVLFGVYTDIPEDKFNIVNKGFMYWNEATTLKLFFDMGRIDMAPGSPFSNAFVIVGRDTKGELNEKTCAVTKWATYANGCFANAHILVSDQCLEYSPEQFETVIRHEAGHVLGLDHSPNFTDLMFMRIEGTVQHPLDANDSEIQNVINLYSGP